MKPFFELRVYEVLPGKMNEWVEFMEKTIIPFQRGKGMVIKASFVLDSTDSFLVSDGERSLSSVNDGNTFVWIRRFESVDHKKDLYKAVYESEEWTTTIAPTVAKLIDRNTIVVHNLSSTPDSLLK
ncbi:MAG: NIPSNAP family containing protein [Betaproteobacteria bacterium]|jgi:hypothetical protein|nr:NIPSNAP family containing protein [Betaproteobacteria bacterium]MDC3408297.1 NIPSNAP family protein [Burkholderiales bacterium]MBT5670905.1 NIPSNAP family containing protein [Betaproteobacteria bacterium]MBT6530397.1 NIPSNAP family containing protein [Betaproteobacteria bacterium]MBT7426926.1 NIPSNAP family containing protein [Betaproteobacteria bacterium]